MRNFEKNVQYAMRRMTDKRDLTQSEIEELLRISGATRDTTNQIADAILIAYRLGFASGLKQEKKDKR